MPTWKFFDCNVMIGNTIVPKPTAIPDGRTLLAEMDHFGIAQALFYHEQFSDEETNQATIQTARMSDRLIPCWVMPTAPVRIQDKLEDQVDRMLEAGVKATIFVMRTGAEYPLMRLRVYDLHTVFERLNRHKIPTMIPADHFEKETSAHTYGWDQVEDICRNFPDIPVILLQPKYAAQHSLISMMQRHPNLHFTIPLAARFRQLEIMVQMFGAQRAIFGTNLPFVDPALPIGMIQYGALSEEEKCLIAGENLKRLLAKAG